MGRRFLSKRWDVYLRPGVSGHRMPFSYRKHCASHLALAAFIQALPTVIKIANSNLRVAILIQKVRIDSRVGSKRAPGCGSYPCGGNSYPGAGFSDLRAEILG